MVLHPASLDLSSRRSSWAALEGGEVDLLVVGGGVTGAGVALDAATRGLTVALVEQADLASGTSSRSSKLFHGGLRYLEQLDVGLVREALRERELMLTRLAPHLVRPVAFLYPLKHRLWERPYVSAGLTLYDRLGGARSVPGFRQLTRRSALALAPALRRDALVGAVQYYDAQADDARHTMMVARTAATYGATVLTSVKVTGLAKAGERVVGAHLRDLESGAETTVRASVVVNATGVWTDDVQTMAGGRGRFHVRASKGIHVLVPRDRINSETGMILRTEKSVLFVIPWDSHWIIGTTDTDWELDKAHPAASREDIDYLLEHLNSVLAVPLTHDDIDGVYAGLRPLLSGESDSTSQLSREHAVARPQPGLISIAGGKYTTYRVMAADAVDAARADLGPQVPDSVTHETPLLGAEGYAALTRALPRLSERTGLPGWRVTRLLDRYGSLVEELIELAEEDPTLWEPLEHAPEHLRVEVRYAVTHEGALHLDDVLARRTRISITTRDRGVESAPEVAALMAPVLGWSEDHAAAEVKAWSARVDAEREANRAAHDQEANAERLAAPGVRESVSRVPT